MTNAEDFGSTIAGSRWFNREPEIERVVVEPVMEIWRCPMEGCGGEMKNNGFVWPSYPPGYHHTCDKCGFTAAIKTGPYPAQRFIRKSEP